MRRAAHLHYEPTGFFEQREHVSMSRVAFLTALISGGLAWAQPVSLQGDLVVVQDPDGGITGLVGMENMSIIPSHQEQFCRAAFNAARAVLPDDYDGVVTFSTSEQISDLENVWQGSPVRPAASGIGRVSLPWSNTYVSNRLSQCVFMGTLGRSASFFPGGAQGPDVLPANPDDKWSPSLGIPLPGVQSLTGIEMLGHEYGHHWLMGIDFDLADGRGSQHYLRGWIEDNNGGGQGHANQHYSDLTDSRSVMYGECITKLDAGVFQLAGCERKYSHLDQYLMGLRPACAADPLLVLEDPMDLGHGVDSLSMPTGSSRIETGKLERFVRVEDVQRVMGTRNPPYPNAQRCWKVAFIVVLAPGQTTIPAAMLAKVQAYQRRWPQWFNRATDGRGFMDVSLDGGARCQLIGMDGGAGTFAPADPCIFGDAGVQPPVDAGLVEDAGVELDAGVEQDAGVPDAGPVDAGAPPAMEQFMDPQPGGSGDVRTNTLLKDRCGCDAGPASMAVALAALLLGRRSRRRFGR